MKFGSRGEVSSRIKAERERLTKSVGALADLLMVSRATQSSYENGTTLPDIEYLHRFSEAGGDAYFVLTGNQEGAVENPDLLWQAFLFTASYADRQASQQLSETALGEMALKFYRAMAETHTRQTQGVGATQLIEVNH